MGPEVSVLLERFGAVYVEVPKVACTSIKAALARLLGIPLGRDGNPHQRELPAPGRVAEAGGRLYPGLFTFVFVRNPWDRLVSCYRDKIRGEVAGITRFTIRPGVADCLARHEAFFADMSFQAFVRAVASIPDSDSDAHIRSQYTFVQTRSGKLGADFVGRYENLERDMAHVAREIGLPESFALPRLQAGPNPAHYADYYCGQTRELVAKRFREDISAFGYEFSSGRPHSAEAVLDRVPCGRLDWRVLSH